MNGGAKKPWMAFLALGTLIPACVLAGAALGWLADKTLDTAPWGFAAGFLLGIFTAFYTFFDMVRRFAPRGPSSGENGGEDKF
jgi:F0F1-type ATP synthase assembly protein I